MLSDHEDVIGDLLQRIERLDKDNKRLMDSVTHWMNNANTRYNQFHKAGRFEEARQIAKKSHEPF